MCDDIVYCSIKQAIDTLAVPGVSIAHRLISKGDELTLIHEEKVSLPFTSLERLRASAAARNVARELMKPMGFVDFPILRGTFGNPIWPAGIVGSMAHNTQIAVAAIALQRELEAVGIDIENVEPLPPNMLDLICTPLEIHAISDYPLGTKLLFVIKEAIYKAAYPLDHKFLDFHEIQVDPAGRIAMTSTGRTFTLHWCLSSHIIAVATVRRSPITS
ncbi:MAG TPA: 4'-phosphopantetheinyl transferase superfamily protein [Candidatus Nitrosocosmicus sp.]|nr:4'-phosphopantetheinyl transferase superfamily protein [Candidatus Nitrosocosmicus sp.]